MSWRSWRWSSPPVRDPSAPRAGGRGGPDRRRGLPPGSGGGPREPAPPASGEETPAPKGTGRDAVRPDDSREGAEGGPRRVRPVEAAGPPTRRSLVPSGCGRCGRRAPDRRRSGRRWRSAGARRRRARPCAAWESASAHRIEAPPPARSGARPRRAAAAAAAGAQGSVRLSPELRDYFRRLEERVRSSWVLPGGAGARRGETRWWRLRIVIEKDGRVSEERIEQGSGNLYFDDSVRRAIRKASPLPVPPEQLRGGEDHYEVGFRFHGGCGDEAIDRRGGGCVPSRARRLFPSAGGPRPLHRHQRPRREADADRGGGRRRRPRAIRPSPSGIPKILADDLALTDLFDLVPPTAHLETVTAGALLREAAVVPGRGR